MTAAGSHRGPHQHSPPTWHTLAQHEQLGEDDVGAPPQLIHEQLLEHGDVGRGAAKLRREGAEDTTGK